MNIRISQRYRSNSAVISECNCEIAIKIGQHLHELLQQKEAHFYGSP